MNRLVGLWIIAGVLVGCSQGREGLRVTEGLGPAALPPGMPPIEERVNAGPWPGEPPSVADRPTGTAAQVASAPPVARADIQPVSPDDPELTAERRDDPTRTEGKSTVDPAVTRLSAAPDTAPFSLKVGPQPEQELPIPESEDSTLEPGQTLGEWAARVDNDIITWNELQSEVARRYQDLDGQTQVQPGVREAIAANVLDHLIDRSLVIQKARRNELKDAKRWELINKDALRLFEQERLPTLLRKYQVEDRFALERVMSERNESYEEMIDSFKLEAIYQQFLMMNIGSKIHVDLPEMRSYYFEHRDDEAFQQGPELTWREILVRSSNHPSRDDARAKIDEAKARLDRGEAFDSVAQSLSEGPNATAGGLWKTVPGSYAVPAVNASLASLRPGEMSDVIAGPNGWHLVLLEASRPAGRKSFEDVQVPIRELLKERRQTRLINDYLKDLYGGAVVTTVFKEYVPRHLREDDEPGG